MDSKIKIVSGGGLVILGAMVIVFPQLEFIPYLWALLVPIGVFLLYTTINELLEKKSTVIVEERKASVGEEKRLVFQECGKVKDLIAKNRAGKAIDVLMAYSNQQKVISDEITLISSSYSDLKDREIKGLEVTGKEKQEINNRILELLKLICND